MLVFENNWGDVNKMPNSLLLAFNKRSWIPVIKILSRFCIISTADAIFNHIISAADAEFFDIAAGEGLGAVQAMGKQHSGLP
ncbi:hypothetical protein SORBI_3002G104050 [Sorghum bicolor]|uniref:Uncharacterized protein n=1 Tax=Sorghum bicolor TaxID=4558 RepID=A0A1W0W363_SORBI|nr:hypothetical protein SORBI_3002G104050 [Sorghum bicolor]